MNNGEIETGQEFVVANMENKSIQDGWVLAVGMGKYNQL